jgi:PAS domain S-box-containing protein
MLVQKGTAMQAIPQRVIWLWPRSLAVLFLLCVFPYGVGHAQIKPIRRVFIINEVNTTFPGIPLLDDGIRLGLATSPYQLEIYREYMDTVYFPDPADQQRFRDFYIRKYQDRKPDVIITVGPSPLKFMVEKHQLAFPGVPIVFCLPYVVPSTLALDHDFTGVENELAPRGTVEAALRLEPHAKHVVVVGGMSATDKRVEGVVKEALRPYEGNFDISYLTTETMPNLLERLKHLPQGTIVLYIGFGLDAAGTKFVSGSEGATLVVGAANAPVFSLFDVHLNHGEVGGKVSYLHEQGRIAGGLAMRVLNGERPQNIPYAKAGSTYIFDWRALKRWGFSESNLPSGSIVLNREPTLWDSYKWYIVGGLCLLIAQTLLIVGLFWQRTTRRKAEAELALTYDRLRLAVEAGKSVGWDWDIKTGQDRWFGDLQTVFGIPSDTYSGSVEDFRRRIYPGDKELVWKAVADAKQSRKPYAAEFRVIRDDGTLRWIAATGKFYYRNDGEAERMVGMAVDITERRRAEAAVRESEERFRLLANTAPVMIWTTGVDKMCDYCNKPWLDFTGHTLEQELGDGWAKGIHHEDVAMSLKTYVDAFDKRDLIEIEYRLRRYDGEYRWIFDTGVPRFNSDGSFAGYIGCCIDVTERKLAQEALSTIGRRLIEAHEEERTWIGRELHDDINQQLALLAVELDQWGKEESRANFSENLSHAQKRITEIAKDVQALSHRLHSSKLDYLGLTAAARSFCKELSEKAKVEVQFHHSAVPSITQKEVSLCLFRVLQEALQNATKHSGVRVFHVNLRGIPDGLELTVSDDGKGFDEREGFSQQGLGLISMRERLQMVHGVFDVRTQPGGGTTISARVPLPRPEMQAKAG